MMVIALLFSGLALQGIAGDAEIPPSLGEGEDFVYLPPTGIGADRIGKRLPLDDLVWLGTGGREPLPTEGRVTLVRWWTETCPYCETSLPAIEELRARYGSDGFQAVAVYHRKSADQLGSRQIVETARAFGYAGNVAVDPDWRVLKAFYLSTGHRSATSVSFLLDGDGLVRYVHPGPVFFPSDRPDQREENADFEDIDTAVRYLLREAQMTGE